MRICSKIKNHNKILRLNKFNKNKKRMHIRNKMRLIYYVRLNLNPKTLLTFWQFDELKIL